MENLSRGIMRVIDRYRTTLLPGWILPAKLLQFCNDCIDVQFERIGQCHRVDRWEALLVGPAQVWNDYFGYPAMKTHNPQSGAG